MATETPVHDVESRVGPPHGGPADVGVAEETDEVSLFDVLIVLAEGWRTILWTTAGFVIVGILVSLLLPVRYTATVTLLPPQQNASLSAQLASQLGSISSVAALAGGGTSGLLRNPNNMYVGLLKSRTVEDAMIERFGLMAEYHKKYLSDARMAFEHHAIVDAGGKDGLIHISVEDHDPRRAAELANGYVDRFRDLSEHLAISEAGQRRLFFEQQLKQASQNLADAEEALKQTEQKTGVIQLDSQARALIESGAALSAQIRGKEVQIQGMQTYATGENAQLIEAEQELASLRGQLARLGGGAESGNGIIVPKGQMTGASLEYVRKLRELKYYETIFDVLARQFAAAKLDEAREGALIQVVDPAVTPDRKSYPKRTLMVIFALIVGLLAGTFYSLSQSALRRMREDPQASSKLALLRRSIS